MFDQERHLDNKLPRKLGYKKMIKSFKREKNMKGNQVNECFLLDNGNFSDGRFQNRELHVNEINPFSEHKIFEDDLMNILENDFSNNQSNYFMDEFFNRYEKHVYLKEFERIMEQMELENTSKFKNASYKDIYTDNLLDEFRDISELVENDAHVVKAHEENYEDNFMLKKGNKYKNFNVYARNETKIRSELDKKKVLMISAPNLTCKKEIYMNFQNEYLGFMDRNIDIIKLDNINERHDKVQLYVLNRNNNGKILTGITEKYDTILDIIKTNHNILRNNDNKVNVNEDINDYDNIDKIYSEEDINDYNTKQYDNIDKIYSEEDISKENTKQYDNINKIYSEEDINDYNTKQYDNIDKIYSEEDINDYNTKQYDNINKIYSEEDINDYNTKHFGNLELYKRRFDNDDVFVKDYEYKKYKKLEEMVKMRLINQNSKCLKINRLLALLKNIQTKIPKLDSGYNSNKLVNFKESQTSDSYIRLDRYDSMVNYKIFYTNESDLKDHLIEYLYNIIIHLKQKYEYARKKVKETFSYKKKIDVVNSQLKTMKELLSLQSTSYKGFIDIVRKTIETLKKDILTVNYLLDSLKKVLHENTTKSACNIIILKINELESKYRNAIEKQRLINIEKIELEKRLNELETEKEKMQKSVVDLQEEKNDLLQSLNIKSQYIECIDKQLNNALKTNKFYEEQLINSDGVIKDLKATQNKILKGANFLNNEINKIKKKYSKENALLRLRIEELELLNENKENKIN